MDETIAGAAASTMATKPAPKREPRPYVFRPTILPLTIPEKAFTRKVIELARGMGWMVAHFEHTLKAVRIGTLPTGKPQYQIVPDRGAVGWPDLVLAKHGRLLYRELKTEAKSSALEPEQAEWLAELQDAGCDAKVWRPRDWAEIEFELAGHISKPLL